jgi:hypothetical protein
LILSVTSFELKWEVDSIQDALKISGDKVIMDLPDKLHFSAIIYEMQKQFYHGKNWYNQKKEDRINSIGFRFKRWKSQLLNDL